MDDQIHAFWDHLPLCKSHPWGSDKKSQNPSSLRMAGNLAFLLRASEAPPAILGPSGAAKRLPGLKNQIFLKLAPLISELLLGRPWASPTLP